jgi:formylmethanofuran dehydrogenase subunit A
LIIEDGDFINDHEGKIIHVAPAYDPAIEKTLRPFFQDYYTIEFDNYAVADQYLHRHQVIPSSRERERV